jgi:hypothetical protein
MMKNLHPDSRPKKEKPAHFEFANLLELCMDVVHSEGWTRSLEVSRVPGTKIVQITEAQSPEVYEPQIVFSASEEDFDRGEISRAVIRSSCRDFFLST